MARAQWRTAKTDGRHAYALIAGPEPRRLVAGLSNGEMWETRDSGDSWVQLGFRLPGVHRSMIRIED